MTDTRPPSYYRRFLDEDECRWCHRLVSRRVPHHAWNRMTFDHLLPRERDGTWEPHNIVVACQRCNQARACADHCIAALCCAVSVLGPRATVGEIHNWFLRIRGPVGKEAENWRKQGWNGDASRFALAPFTGAG